MGATTQKSRLVVGMEANEVIPNLWIGSMPLEGDVDDLNQFDCVVFAADNNQPTWIKGFRKTAIRCGIRDGHITDHEKNVVRSCAKMVADRLFKGERVLCTCMAGLNRSSLVAALAMKMATRYSTNEIIDLIRKARGPAALSNWSFVGFLAGQSPF